MKKISWILVLLSATHVFADLPILRTQFRKDKTEAVRLYAQQNNTEAQVELALRYYAGFQVPQDFPAAFKWMSIAANAGRSDAQDLLSRMYADGIGTTVDPSKSEMWFAKALANDPDNAELKERYANYLTEKKGNLSERNAFLKICSEAGYAPAFADFWRPEAIRLYSTHDDKGALKIFRQLAEKNDPEAMYYLASMYMNGRGGLPEDYVEAFDLYHKSALSGFAPAQYALASMYQRGQGTVQNVANAAVWYEKSARNGNIAAQFELAESKFSKAVFLKGQADVEDLSKEQKADKLRMYNQEMARAGEWYRKAADGNDPRAQYVLGRLYASGEGVTLDDEKSVQYYRLAAAQGNVEALFYLGLMAHAGLGVEKDVNQAFAFYKKAADQGSRAAMFYLGNCYRFGTDVERNARKGESYYFEKVLNGVSIGSNSDLENDPSELLKNIWVLRAAREYGVILWHKAASEQGRAAARRWVSLAARAGDVSAKKILLQMTSADHRKAAEVPSVISETPVDPRADAMALKREIHFLYPYIQMNLKDLYAKTRAGRIIGSVFIREGQGQNASGDDLWELFIKYKRPGAHSAVGFRGVLLMGVEFENTDTKEKYWTFNESTDSAVSSLEDSDTDVSLFVNLSSYPHLRVSNWAVVYGHRFDDNLTLAVFDERQKLKTEGTLEQMVFKNQYTLRLKSTVVATEDISGILSSAAPATPSKSKSDSKDSSTLNSLLSPFGLGQ